MQADIPQATIRNGNPNLQGPSSQILARAALAATARGSRELPVEPLSSVATKLVPAHAEARSCYVGEARKVFQQIDALDRRHGLQTEQEGRKFVCLMARTYETFLVDKVFDEQAFRKFETSYPTEKRSSAHSVFGRLARVCMPPECQTSRASKYADVLAGAVELGIRADDLMCEFDKEEHAYEGGPKRKGLERFRAYQAWRRKCQKQQQVVSNPYSERDTSKLVTEINLILSVLRERGALRSDITDAESILAAEASDPSHQADQEGEEPNLA